MGQGEGVEGAGEKGHRAGFAEVEAPVEQPLLREEAVQLSQHGGTVVEGQPLAGELVLRRQQLALGEHEGAALFVASQLAGAEHPPSQHVQRLLKGGAVDAAESPHQKPQQPLPAAAEHLVHLREPGTVSLVVLIDHAHGAEGGGDHPVVGATEGSLEIPNPLLQLGGRQPQEELSQIGGDILGELILSHLQPL